MSNPSTAAPVQPSWWLRLIFGRRPAWTLMRVLLLVSLSFFVFDVVLIPVRIKGISMLPTYRDGSVNFVNKWSYRWRPIKRGDVVGLRVVGPNGLYLKRVIGLPGERIAMERGVVLINGQPLTEPYLPWHNPRWRMPERTLGPTQYFVVGDNRSMPISDHFHGPIDAQLIVGKVLF